LYGWQWLLGVCIKRILIVDDNTMNLKIVTRILSGEKYTCETVAQPELVLDKVRTFLPDVILLDLYMPVIDGFTVLKSIKADPDLERIPIIMTTAETRQDVVIKCLDLGAYDYITKPFETTNLLARVRSAIRYKDLTDKLVESEKKHIFSALIVSANHNINQPLTVIKGNLDLLKWNMEEKLTSEDLKLIDRSLNAVDIIKNILGNMSEMELPEYTNYIGSIDMIDFRKK